DLLIRIHGHSLLRLLKWIYQLKKEEPHDPNPFKKAPLPAVRSDACLRFRRKPVKAPLAPAVSFLRRTGSDSGTSLGCAHVSFSRAVSACNGGSFPCVRRRNLLHGSDDLKRICASFFPYSGNPDLGCRSFFPYRTDGLVYGSFHDAARPFQGIRKLFHRLRGYRCSGPSACGAGACSRRPRPFLSCHGSLLSVTPPPHSSLRKRRGTGRFPEAPSWYLRRAGQSLSGRLSHLCQPPPSRPGLSLFAVFPHSLYTGYAAAVFLSASSL